MLVCVVMVFIPSQQLNSQGESLLKKQEAIEQIREAALADISIIVSDPLLSLDFKLLAIQVTQDNCEFLLKHYFDGEIGIESGDSVGYRMFTAPSLRQRYYLDRCKK